MLKDREKIERKKLFGGLFFVVDFKEYVDTEQ